MGRWARWLFDRGLEHYAALVERDGRIPHSLAFGVNVFPQSRGTAYLTTARYAANAMRALQARLQDRPSARFRRRCTPSTRTRDGSRSPRPRYNTAIVAVNQGAFPYGGLDLARLYDARQEVAANIGGEAPAAFGLSVRAGRTLLETQYGRRSGASALRLPGRPAAPLRRATRAGSSSCG